MMPKVQAKSLVKVFDDVRALDGLDMAVPEGAVYGLVGPNGAGKTTVLNHVSGAYRPTSGEVLVAGEPVFENPQLKATIAFIPSDFYYYQ